MKRIYEVQVLFAYPTDLRGMTHTENYWIEAGSVVAAARLGRKIAQRSANGGYAPRVERVEERGSVDARA